MNGGLDMKRKLLSLALSFALCLTLLPGAALAADETAPAYGGGTGTQDDPWIIATVEDITTLAATVNDGTYYEDAYFKQTADLDMTGVDWEPIGYSDNDDIYFCGNYDGDNHTISNITSSGKMDSQGQTTAGIFGFVAEGSISNLHVRSAKLSAAGDDNYGHAGGLLGVAYEATVINCSVTDSKIKSTATSNSNNCAGGIAGYSAMSNFSKCASVSNEIDSQCYSGGVVGEIDDSYSSTDSRFVDCYAAECSVTSSTTPVNGFSFAGGFIGEVTEDNPTLEHCYVYDTTTSVENTSALLNGVGVFVGNFYTNLPNYQAQVTTTDCYYGECSTDENFGTATLKDQTEFEDGTVTGLLGDAFVQGEDYPIINIPVASVALDQEELSLFAGENETVIASVLPLVASNQKVTWTSSDDTVATVDENGVVTAVSAGAAVITVTTEDGSLTASCTVTVTVPVTGVSLDKDEMSLTVGETGTLTATVTPENATNGNITWASDKADVATVDENGVVSAVSAGTAVITVTTEDGSLTASCTVTVAPKPSSGSSDRDDSSSTPSYPVTQDRADNGAVSVSPKNAIQGSTVTVKVTPDSGYVVDEVAVTDNRGNEVKLTQTGAGKYTFTMPAGAVTVKPIFVRETGESPFRDVSERDYYYDAVRWAAEEGITSGTSADLFSPSAPCTRAQMVTFLWRAAGSPNVGGALTFTDVADSAYYAPAVRWAASVGVTSGTGAGRFSPDDPCTRGQMAAFLYRWQQSPAASGSNPFADVVDSDYYYAAVLWAYQKGVTQGVSASAFAPSAPCTRGQMAMFLYQLKG